MLSAVLLLAADCTVVELTVASLYAGVLRPPPSARALDLDRRVHVHLAAPLQHIALTRTAASWSVQAAPRKKYMIAQTATSPTSSVLVRRWFITQLTVLLLFPIASWSMEMMCGLIYGARQFVASEISSASNFPSQRLRGDPAEEEEHIPAAEERDARSRMKTRCGGGRRQRKGWRPRRGDDVGAHDGVASTSTAENREATRWP